MDIDRRDDSDFEPSDGEARVAINRNAGRVPKARARPISTGSDDDNTGHHPKRSLKWERLKPSYKDEYLELFRETFESRASGADYYTSSQHGAVMWEASEKAKLFEALLGVGRHDLPRLADRIGTKSELEVKSYLDRLRTEETDRQLFERQTKNISLADIPAAIEIGSDCENRLEQAADALAAFQEQYDHAVGQQDYSLQFIITQDVATRLDKETDEALGRLDQAALSEDESTSKLSLPHELFQLRMFNELSEKFFMQGNPKRPHDYWQNIAEPNERPAVTQNVIAEFQDLVVSLTSRLVQATLFLVESRIRASTTKHHEVRGVVKREDVQSALEVLSMRGDLWEYWVLMPRRSGFKIVSGSKRKGDSTRDLSYDEVEAALSVRHHPGRRRSLSVTSEMSSNNDEGSETSNSELADVEDTSDSSEPEERVYAHASDSGPENHESMEEELSDGQNHGKKPQTAVRLTAVKRKRLLEEELDQYVEAMDEMARQEEETRLASLLGFEDIALIKSEPIELGRRPKVLRKSVEDVSIWKGAYQAAWESHPTSLPAEDLDRVATKPVQEDNI